MAATDPSTDRGHSKYDKYKILLREGKSRQEIELSLKQNSFTVDEITQFWLHVAAEAISVAISMTPNDVDAIWKQIMPFQYFQRGFELPPVPTRKSPGDIRVVFISDTHSLHDEMPSIPDGDILIHGGDFTDTGDREEVIAFNEFLGKLPHRYKIVIGGNHECTFDKPYYKNNWQRYGHPYEYDSDEVRSRLTNALYLEDSLVSVEGYRIYGTPWQPEFCNWAFNLPRGAPELREKWNRIPSDIDILLTHSPPLGRGDRVGIMNVGDADLLEQVQQRIKPSFHLFGHVHEGYGASFDGTTIFLNGSNCTDEYQAINPIMVFDLPPRMANGIDHSADYHVLLASQQQQRENAIKRFNVKGTCADQLFEETLRIRPVLLHEARAMKYCFRDKKISSFEQKKQDEISPNYSIAAGGTALSRRITTSIIPQESTTSTSQHELNGLRRGLGLKRAGLAVLPEEDENVVEEDCIMCKLNVPGHVHPGKGKVPIQVECILCKLSVPGHIHRNDVASPASPPPTPPSQEVECVLCKYNVSGHVHQGKPIEVQINPAPSPSRIETKAEDGLSKADKRVSSWF